MDFYAGAGLCVFCTVAVSFSEPLLNINDLKSNTPPSLPPFLLRLLERLGSMMLSRPRLQQKKQQYLFDDQIISINPIVDFF